MAFTEVFPRSISSQDCKADILLVDDNPQNLRLLRTILRQQGYKVRATANEEFALNAVKLSQPDLILLNINLPNIEGYELCKQLKANQQTAEIPVIFISALDDVLDKVKGFEAGGVDYITKPFDFHEVLVKIKNQLTLIWQKKQLLEQQKQMVGQNTQLQLLLTTTQAINESSNFQTALEATLHQVCEKIGWDYGEFWIPKNDSATDFEYGKGWYASEKRFEEFRYQSEALTFVLNTSIVGKICHNQSPYWLTDISVEPSNVFLRCQLAKEIGLRACLGVPILFNDQVLAVLVFFKREVTEPEPRLIELVKALASQLSSLIQRKRSESALRKSQQQLAAMAANIPGSVYRGVFHADGRFSLLYISEGERGLSGLAPEEVIANSERYIELIHPECRTKFETNWRAAIETLEPSTQECRIISTTGVVKWIRDSACYSRLDNGDVIIDGVRIDVSDVHDELHLRQQIEAELRRTQGFLNSLLENLPVGVFAKDAQELRFVFWNKTSTELMSYTASDVLGKSDYDLFEHQQASFFTAQDREALSTRRLVDHPAELIHTLRGERLFHVKKIPIFDEAEHPQYVLGIVEDITERKQAEERLRVLERAIAASSNGITISDPSQPDNPIIYVNPGFERMTGYCAEEVIGKNCRFLQGQETEQPAIPELRQAIRAGKQTQRVLRNYRKDGTLFWNEFSVSPVRDADGNLTHYIGIQTDITARKEAEEALRQQKELLQTIFDHIPVMVTFYDAAGQLQLVNRELERVLGWSKAELEQCDILAECYPDPEYRQSVLDFMVAATGKWQDLKTKTHDGRFIYTSWANIRLSDGTSIGIGQDITERKLAEESLQIFTQQERERALQLEQTLKELQRTQAQLVQNEKMASLGQLVAGVAHEINNPTSFISCNIHPASEYAQDLLNLLKLYQNYYPEPVAEITEQLERIEPEFIAQDFPKLLASMKEGANRIKEIVLSLKNFSRLDEADRKRVNIHEGIDNTLLILRHRLKSQSKCPEIQVIKEYGQLPLIECYPGQLNQVFMNLLSNAIDALRELHIGGLAVEGSHQSLLMKVGQGLGQEERESHCSLSRRLMAPNCQGTTPYIRIRTETLEQDKVVICVADNGSGVSEEDQQRVFDPFFTTKSPGEGTGLGLSISYQIVVEKHKGRLRCRSTPGQGTEFIIELPTAQCRKA